jgi:hypothetical protein
LLPDAVVEYAKQGIQILKDFEANNYTADVDDWFIEATPTAIDGMGEFVISSRREDLALQERRAIRNSDEMTQLQIDVIMAGMDELMEQMHLEINDLKAELEQVRNAPSPSQDRTPALAATRNEDALDFTDQEDKQLTAALVLASLSFVFWMIWALIAIKNILFPAKQAVNNPSNSIPADDASKSDIHPI